MWAASHAPPFLSPLPTKDLANLRSCKSGKLPGSGSLRWGTQLTPVHLTLTAQSSASSSVKRSSGVTTSSSGAALSTSSSHNGEGFQWRPTKTYDVVALSNLCVDVVRTIATSAWPFQSETVV